MTPTASVAAGVRGRTRAGTASAAARPVADAGPLLADLRGLLDDPAPVRRELLDALFVGERAVSLPVFEGRLSGRDQRCLVELGLIRLHADRAEPLARLDRVGDLVIASDLHRHRRHRDFVVGPGPASHLLARHVRPVTGGRALDLGCGSGIQSLLLARAGMAVTALDISRRALAFTRFNAALNDLPGIVTVEGDFLATGAEGTDDPSEGPFEVVVANPPFVLAPASRLVYRDRPLPGDEVTARTVERVAAVLGEDGRGYVLGNWIERQRERDGDEGTPAPDRWLEPVRAWFEALDPGLDVVVSRVADHDAASYAAIWNRDLPPAERPAAVASWAAALEAEGVERIHVGVIAIARTNATRRSRHRLSVLDARRGPVDYRTIEDALGGGAEPAS